MRAALFVLYFVPPVVKTIPYSLNDITEVLTFYPTNNGSAPTAVSLLITNTPFPAAKVGALGAPPVGFVTAASTSLKSVCTYLESRATKFHLNVLDIAKPAPPRSVLIGINTSIGLSKET
jgi:hypothetical protein